MVLTNALLSISFGLITNFCALIPGSQVYSPKTPAELHDCIVGSPSSPIELQVATAGGADFGIAEGAVYYFLTPGSLFRQGDPRQLDNYAGAAVLTSNQVIQIASNTLCHLLKTNASLSNGKPKLRQGGLYKGERMPFFQVEWTAITPGAHMHGADVEIDARTGKVVFLQLFDDAFFDPVASKEIGKLVIETNAEIKARPLLEPSNRPGQ
jgi:hypothetical protein